MAMFRELKYDKLEEEYSEGQTYEADGHEFKLTLNPPKSYMPEELVNYRWIVTLEDGFEFETSMAADSATFPTTRLGKIKEKLIEANRYQDDYLANAINNEIDKVFREYSK